MFGKTGCWNDCNEQMISILASLSLILGELSQLGGFCPAVVALRVGCFLCLYVFVCVKVLSSFSGLKLNLGPSVGLSANVSLDKRD